MSARDYMHLVEAYRTTEGHRIYWLVQSISVSFGVFAENERELAHKLQEHSSIASLRDFSGPQNREKAQAEFREIIRLLQNYAASAKSLVEHTRRIARKILRNEHLVTYQRRVDQDFKDDALVGFVHDLRNYMLHYSHPPVNRTIRFEQTHGDSVGIELDVSELQQWNDWSPRGREYLEAQAGRVDLARVLSQYSEKVTAFHNWLGGHIDMACKPELDEFWAKHDDWALFCKEHGIPTTDEEFERAFGKGC